MKVYPQRIQIISQNFNFIYQCRSLTPFPNITEKKKREDSPDPGAYTVTLGAVKDHSPEWIFGRQSRDHSFNESNSKIPSFEHSQSMMKKTSGDGMVFAKSKEPGTYSHTKLLQGKAIQSKRFLKENTAKTQSMTPGTSFMKSASNEVSTANLTTEKKSKLTNSSNNKSPYNRSVIKEMQGMFQDKMKHSEEINKSGRRNRSSIGGSNLGPGSYNIQRNIGENAPSYSLKGRDIKENNNMSPGPGEYDPKEDLSKSRVKVAVIKGVERFGQSERNDSPGPGNYHREDENFARSATPISIKGRFIEKKRESLPGPGAYDPTLEAIRSAIKNIKIASSQKPIETSNSKYPKGSRNIAGLGPGAYTVSQNHIGEANSFQSRSFKIGQALRLKHVSISNIPGPGEYEFNNQRIGTDGPRFTLGSKTPQKIRNEIPGPGNYDPMMSHIKDRSPSFKLRSRTPILENRMTQDFPGPGQYTPGDTIGKNGPQISLKGKPTPKKIDQNPGPGSYEAAIDIVRSKILAYKLGSSQRQSVEIWSSQGIPGPGQYEQATLVGKDTPSIQIKPLPQSQNKSRNHSPGPGQYDPNQLMTKSTTIVHSFQGSHQTIEDQIRLSTQAFYTPGPGTYQQNTLIGQDAPQIGIKGKPSPNKIGNIPGPGSYEPSTSNVKDKSPSFKIGRSRRDYLSMSLSTNAIPGPGQYDPQLMRSSQIFSLGGKTPEKQINGLPGPGHYDAKDTLSKHSNPLLDFSRSPERKLYKTPSIDVGPGQYAVHDINEQTLLSGRSFISYSFSKGQSKDKLSMTPGPGSYELKKTFGVHAQQKSSTSLRQTQ